MTVSEYVESLNERYKTGISREHSYRGDLQNLLESMLDKVLVTNEPARIECGAPDYIQTRKGLELLHCRLSTGRKMAQIPTRWGIKL